jgi:hypothetical protein
MGMDNDEMNLSSKFFPLCLIVASGLISGCFAPRSRAPLAEPATPVAEPAATSSEGVTPLETIKGGDGTSSSAEDADSPLRKASLRFMAALKIDTMLTNVVQNVVGNYRSAMPRVPPPFWDEVQSVVDLTWIQERFQDEIVKIYTLEELTTVCDFFESPAGQTFLKNERVLQQANSQHVGAFSRRLNLEIEKRLRARKLIN